MHIVNTSAMRWRKFLLPILGTLLVAGCRSDKEACCAPTTASATNSVPAPAVAPAAPAPSAIATPSAATAPIPPSSEPKMPANTGGIIRINAGASAPYTDSNGNVWAPDEGFDGGDTIARADDLTVANTKDPALYRTEHYGMTSFSQKLPNGKYTVKLYFAENYEDISGPGQRVFSFNVAGHEFKDFDIWKASGGAQRACVESVEVDITGGKLEILFTTDVQSPAINAVEIVPAG